MKVKHFSRSKKGNLEKEDIYFCELNYLCENSDIIGLFIPDDKTTKSIISKEVMKNIKKDSIVVSISHTDIFDLQNLIKNLNENKFSLIQTYMNTISDKDKDILMKTKNVILYPSIAIQTRETLKNKQEILVNNLQSFLQGKPKNKVN